MKSLSQSDYGLIRSLYQDVYAPDIAESILDEFTDEDLDDLTDEYIEEQVIEFFQECLEEGLDIDIVEQTICESVDTELEILTEVTNPAQVAAMRMRDKTSAASGEGQKSGRDAGSMARAKLKVSKQKVGSASPEKKASKLSQIKGAVKKVGQAAKGGIGLATRAVGTAVRAGSAVKSAAKKGYERGRQGSGGGSSSSSSDSAPTSSASGPSSSSSSGGSSSSSSSGGGSSSAAPTKRKDGLLKRGLKKVVRGITKGVSAAAGAVKAGADSLTDRARKEDMNYSKELATIKELYSQVCDNQNEEVEEYIDFLITEGYDCSDLTWNDMYEEYESLDEGLRSAVKRLLGGKKKEEPAKPMSRGDELRKKYNVGPEKSDTSAKAQILKKTRAKADSDQKEFGGSRYSKGVADRSKAAHERQLKGGYSKYGADDARGSGNKARKRAAALTKEELEATGLFTAKEIEALVESENVDEAITSEKGKAKMKSMIDARTTDSGRAKPGKGQNVKDIKHIGRANVDGYGGTPPNLKVAKNPVKSNFTGLNSGTGNKAKRRADALTRNEEFVDEAMSSYDRNRKRAAQRAADRNAARAAGKTGVVPGVGYVTPNKERETYTDEKGTVRHKSGAKNEEFEQLDEISKKLARSYVEKGIDDQRSLDKKAYAKGTSEEDGIKALEKIDKRDKGIGMAHDKLYKGTPNEIERNKKIKVTATGKDPAHNYPKEKSKGIKGLVKRLTRKEELESLRQAYLSMSNGGEQLDEISLKTKIKAYASAQDPDDERPEQGERIMKNIVKKHGEKAGKHAHDHEQSYHYGRGPSAKERIEKNRDYRTTKAGKMHGQDQKKLKSDLKKNRTQKEETDSLYQAYLSISNGGEQLDELSKKTMGSYVKKAAKDVEKRSYDQAELEADTWLSVPEKDPKIDKRQKGIGRAVGKLTK